MGILLGGLSSPVTVVVAIDISRKSCSNKEYGEAQKRYVVAKSKTDSWLEMIKLRLTEGQLESQEYQAALRHAQNTVASFLSYADEVKRPATPNSLGVLDKIGRILIDAGIAVWRGARAEGLARD